MLRNSSRRKTLEEDEFEKILSDDTTKGTNANLSRSDHVDEQLFFTLKLTQLFIDNKFF